MNFWTTLFFGAFVTLFLAPKVGKYAAIGVKNIGERYEPNSQGKRVITKKADQEAFGALTFIVLGSGFAVMASGGYIALYLFIAVIKFIF